MRVGVNPIVWSNDDLHSLGGEIPLETCLAEARAAGYEGIELGHKFPRTARELGPLLRRHGLALVSGWHSTNLLERNVEAERDAIAPHCALLMELGAQVVIVAECAGAVHARRDVRLADRPRLDDSAIGRLGERLGRLAEAVAPLRLAYHHHMGTVVQTPAEIESLLAATPDEVGMVFDTGHLLLAGGDPLSFLEKHVARVAHVHLKDVRREILERPLASFLEAVMDGIFTVPGDGHIDFSPIVRTLQDGGYDGWVVVEAEQDPERAPPAEYARRGYEHVAGLLR